MVAARYAVADGDRTSAGGACINTSGQGIGAGRAIVVVVAARSAVIVDAVIVRSGCGLGGLQLGDVDRIGRIGACGDVCDAAFAAVISDGHNPDGCDPCDGRRIAVFVCRMVGLGCRGGFGNRTVPQGNAACVVYGGVVAQGEAVCGGDFCRVAQDHGTGCGDGVFIADDAELVQIITRDGVVVAEHAAVPGFDGAVAAPDRISHVAGDFRLIADGPAAIATDVIT